MDKKHFIDHERKPDPKKPFMMTDRDTQLLVSMYRFGGMLTHNQIRELHFTDSIPRTQRGRLSRLFHYGYIHRTSKSGQSSVQKMLFWLTKKGAQHIAKTLDDPSVLSYFLEYPNWNEVEHDMRIVETLIALYQACERSPLHYHLIETITERALRSTAISLSFTSLKGTPMKRQVIPDAMAIIDRFQPDSDEKYTSRLLIEIDRAHHPDTRFVEHKVLPGSQWVTHPEYINRYGGKGGRWLVVTTTQGRIDFLKANINRLAPACAGLWYFTTFDQINSETIFTHPIWQKPNEQNPLVLFR